MLCNKGITIYHKGFDEVNRHENWTRFNYDNVWFFGGQGAGINVGYENANNVNVRIFYANHEGLDINNFAIGDIIVDDTLSIDIESQADLSEFLTYDITSILNNNFGNNPHIHIGGK